MLLDPGSGCASPLSIDGVAFEAVAWSTSRISTVQVGQTVLDRYTLRQKSPTPPVQTPYQSRHDHSWRASTLWDRYIWTQGLTIPDPLYKSSTSRWCVKKPWCYAATLEEHHHQEQMALLDQPTNGRRLTQGLLGKIMDQDRKSRRGTH